MSLGTAFENLSRGLGMAYFPAISLSFKESVAFNFGSRPLRYPFGKKSVDCLEALEEAGMRGSLPWEFYGLVVGHGCRGERGEYSLGGCREAQFLWQPY